MRIAVGLILLLAAFAKLDGFRFDPLARDSLLASPRAQIAVIELELFLGLWLLSGLAQRWARYAALVFFGILAVASLYMAIEGRSHCGCFGRVEISPWWTFGIDVMVVLALAVITPRLASAGDSLMNLSLLAKAAIGACFVLGVITTTFVLFVSDLEGTLAFLRGQSISVTPSIVEVGEGIPGEAGSFRVALVNHTAHPIRVVGGTSYCGLNAVYDLPVVVPPKEEREITIYFRYPKDVGLFNQVFEFYTDDPRNWRISGQFRGRVRQQEQ